MCRRSHPLALALLLAGLSGCGSEPEPVGALTVTPAELDLPHAAWRRVGLSWRMTAPLAGLEGEPRVSLHLVDGAGELRRTFDHALPEAWRPGAEIEYEIPVFQSAIAPPLPPGEYGLRGGLYDAAGHRWALVGGRVATVRVGEPGEGFPELSFSADWLPVEDGTDRQILARRWLAGDGAMRIRGYTAAGAVRLRIGIPTAGERQEMALGEGMSEPAAMVRAECSGFEAELTGSGSHTLEIPLVPESVERPGVCTIRIRANFQLVSTENQETRTIALENVAWSDSV